MFGFKWKKKYINLLNKIDELIRCEEISQEHRALIAKVNREWGKELDAAFDEGKMAGIARMIKRIKECCEDKE